VPTPPQPPAVTFDNIPAPQGRRHRQQTRRRTTKPNHTHGTRANRCAPASAASLEVVPEQHFALHGNAFNSDTGTIAEYPELSRCSEGALWKQSNAEEIGRLVQGLGALDPSIEGTNTLFFIPVTALPKDRKATYLRVVSAYRTEKKNPRRIRWTVGGDRVEYPGDTITQTADLTTVKVLINSVLSMPSAKMVTTDLKDFYLGTPMERYEYMRIPVHMIPDTTVTSYQLHNLVHNGYIYAEICKGIYGFPQAGKIANDRLKKFLSPMAMPPLVSPMACGNTKRSP
jgi:hypothetical protein